jgi:hypothetical protein
MMGGSLRGWKSIPQLELLQNMWVTAAQLIGASKGIDVMDPEVAIDRRGYGPAERTFN